MRIHTCICIRRYALKSDEVVVGMHVKPHVGMYVGMSEQGYEWLTNKRLVDESRYVCMCVCMYVMYACMYACMYVCVRIVRACV
jgi:hypothetical protein